MTVSGSPLSSASLQQAIALYLAIAYPDGTTLPKRAKVTIDATRPLEQALDSIERDLSCPVQRRVIRLGNHLYPHMKLAIEQCGPSGSWYISVDCHDAAVQCRDAAEHSLWEPIRLANAEIKSRVERAWRDADLPTLRDRVTKLIEKERIAQAKVTSSKVRSAVNAKISSRLAVPTERPLIMIVDDEEEMAELFAIYLRQEGFRTVVLTDPTLALDMAKRLKPAAFVLDYMMPELSGGELCQSFKANAQLADVPCLVCTYASVAEDDVPCADELLSKPVSREKLIGRLRDHLVVPTRAD